MHFYTGQVLRLDLTALRATVEPLDADWARLFVGGKGLLLRYLVDELPAGAEALASENPLILATGPFAGTAAATCSRLAVGCKSPRPARCSTRTWAAPSPRSSSSPVTTSCWSPVALPSPCSC